MELNQRIARARSDIARTVSRFTQIEATFATLLLVGMLVLASWPNSSSTSVYGAEQAAAAAEKPASNEPDTSDTPSAPTDLPSEKVVFGDDQFTLMVPSVWKVVEPKVNIIEHEFELPSPERFELAVKGEKAAEDSADANAGRITCMSAGGGVQANIDRWIQQFKAPKDAKVVHEQFKVGGLDAHWIEYGGVFSDRRGPFAPPTERPDFRLIGVIVDIKGDDDYFIKVTAPAATMSFWSTAIKSMVENGKGADAK